MIAFRESYVGVPSSQIPAFEGVLQALVTELFEQAKFFHTHVGLNKTWRSRGERSSFRLTHVPAEFRPEFPYTRLRIKDDGGWWADLLWRNPNLDLQGYEDFNEFIVFVEQGKARNMTEEDRLMSWGLGKADIFFEARRKSADVSWYAPTTTFDLKHPLLRVLDWSRKELESGSSDPRDW